MNSHIQSGATGTRPRISGFEVASWIVVALLFVTIILLLPAWGFFSVAVEQGWLPALASSTSRYLGYALLIAISVFIPAMIIAVRTSHASNEAQTFADIESGGRYFVYLRSFVIEDEFVSYGRAPILWAGLFNKMFGGAFGLDADLLLAVQDRNCSLVRIGGKQSLGVPAYRPDDVEWRDFFDKLARGAKGIFIFPFLTEGTMWELSWVIENALPKTVFVLPPLKIGMVLTERPVLGSYADSYDQIKDHYRGRVNFPDYDASGLLFMLGSDENGVGVTVRRDFDEDAFDELVRSLASDTERALETG
jgi:hypothetical protein